MRQFEFVIAGAGAAGLTLAYMLMGSESTKKPTLIIDKIPKRVNDRTWCFWETDQNPFESLVFKSWKKARFKSDAFEKDFDISPYTYKMIRGIDFYEFMHSELAKHPEITWLEEEISGISPEGIVTTNAGTYQGNLVFDSTFNWSKAELPAKSTMLLQHFKGYFLKTEQPAFNPDTFTYMDFSVPQKGDFRFGYVLPFSQSEALVEYTLFSTQLLEKHEYEQGLESYIRDHLGINSFEVQEEEFGVIPMTDYPFRLKLSDRVFRIGISGGFAKASTGYTFLRSQKILSQMVENLGKGLPLDHDLPFQSKRFKKYDNTLLRVLAKPNNSGRQAFADMFKKNGMQKMFRFLDEETTLREELAIMGSTPLLTFGKAFWESITKG